MLHVEPDTTKTKERALLMVFNQNPHVAANTTLKVPLYYSGLSSAVSVSVAGAEPVAMQLARDWTVTLPITMAPNTIQWYLFY